MAAERRKNRRKLDEVQLRWFYICIEEQKEKYMYSKKKFQVCQSKIFD